LSNGPDLSRRTFLTATGAVVAGGVLAGGLAGCGDTSPPAAGTTAPDQTKAYILSGRGRRVSRAALIHNHNWVFVSQAAAEAGRAHPGDTSKVVPIDISVRTWTQWFGGGLSAVDQRGIFTTP
jgi:hypothetical protein